MIILGTYLLHFFLFGCYLVLFILYIFFILTIIVKRIAQLYFKIFIQCTVISSFY